MKQNKKKIILTLSPFMIIAIAIISAFGMVKSKPELKSPPVNIPAPLVEIQQVKFESSRVSVNSQGTVDPKQKTQLISEVSGRVIWVSEKFKNGNFISKNEELLHIDVLDYELALALANANLRDAELKLMEEEVRAKQAESDWKLAQKLNPQANRKATALTLRKPHLASALASLEAKKAHVKIAQRNLLRTRITAPFNAIVDGKSVDIGQYLTLGAPIAQLLSSDEAEVRLPLSQKDIEKLEEQGVNAPAEITLLDSGSTLKWSAIISRIEKKLDPSTREQYVIASIQDPYNLNKKHFTALSLGTFVNVSILGKSYKQVVKVPRYALHNNGQLFTVNESDTLVLNDIDFIPLDDKYLLVKNGLDEGDKLVLTRLPLMTENMQVRVSVINTNDAEPR
ncbi:MAG: efflux RND transporter periplasmic adaptor subunit [Pseudomonadales bacterium]|nr:efflux RND transporter periplasmic adaptor subunit [Pseudomonadales bacterium]